MIMHHMVDSSSVFLLFLIIVSSVLFNNYAKHHHSDIELQWWEGWIEEISEVAAQEKMDVLFLQETHTTAADKIDFGSVVARISLPQPWHQC